MAKDVVGDEPFVVILPDDIISHSPGAISQMVKVSEEMEAGVIAVETVPWDVVENYGVVDATKVSERVYRIQSLVEKPPREEAPSNLTIVGRVHTAPGDISDSGRNQTSNARRDTTYRRPNDLSRRRRVVRL